jgi:hypothetical protein
VQDVGVAAIDPALVPAAPEVASESASIDSLVACHISLRAPFFGGLGMWRSHFMIFALMPRLVKTNPRIGQFTERTSHDLHFSVL